MNKGPKAGPACICGYDGSSWADVDEHILASMHSDEDHARARLCDST